HNAFRELVQSYNKLLEKSVFLKDLTEKIQTEPVFLSGTHHAGRSPSGTSCSPGSGDLPALQKEIADLKISNGELAYEAFELKKRMQERGEWLTDQSEKTELAYEAFELKKRMQERGEWLTDQSENMAVLLELMEGHQLQRHMARQVLEKKEVQLVCANASLKEDYDRLLSRRLLVEQKLHEEEIEQREVIETMTKKKAMQAEQQNNLNERQVSRALQSTPCALCWEQKLQVHHNSCNEHQGGELAPKKVIESTLLGVFPGVADPDVGLPPSSMAVLLELMEGHQLQRQRLEKKEVQLVCANASLKEDYDRLLSRRLLVEQKLHEEEIEQREVIETMTKKKAMQAEQQNNLNERRKDELWMHLVKKALRKTVSAEGDVRQHRSSGSLGSSSLDVSGSLEEETAQPRKMRSRSMISLGSSRFMGAFKSFFDFNFRRDQTDCEMEERWYNPSSVCVICSPPRRALYSKEIHDSEIHAVRFSPNPKMVATGGADRMVKLWYIAGGQLQIHQILQGSNGGITSIEFDPSGLHLLAASFDGSAHLWKLDGKSNESLTGHKGKVTAARFKMSVHRAVTCSMDRTIREWDLQKAACTRCIPVSSYCSDVVCSDMYTISGHHDKKIRFWDSRSEQCFREVTLEEKITSLSLSQDQTQLLSCSRDDTLNLIDMRRGEILQVFRADAFKCGCDWTKAILSTAVNAVAWSLSGDHVVSVDRGKKAVLWSEY
ncbi:PREDICTED: autophagy-related protein 16-2-like, partial [Nanorana parkeri]|uniref:autophagy-related protein 16-2-like n=1 Tax=Nanorana parkeri TaxID=125878 RepID=UPI000854E206